MTVRIPPNLPPEMQAVIKELNEENERLRKELNALSQRVRTLERR